MVPDLPIHTERLTLRLVTETDLDQLHAMRSREDVNRYLFTDAYTREATETLMAKRLKQTKLEADGDLLALAVVRRGEDVMLGEVSLWLRSAEHHQGEVGAVFHPDVHGTGYAYEAVSALLDLAFGSAGLHRVAATADPGNAGSVKLMERLGMRREGLMCENAWSKGAWCDEVVYAILDQEWRSRAR